MRKNLLDDGCYDSRPVLPSKLRPGFGFARHGSNGDVGKWLEMEGFAFAVLSRGFRPTFADFRLDFGNCHEVLRENRRDIDRKKQTD